ncbi:PspC domain-containing protein [Amycolatopsis sp. NPDC059021]|uniref:PspC domain-containing protein n=1 Tax=Amycolatopsis sp. NPDC059021 TaxID=3346704 RepID=UPI0036729659
MTNSVYTPEKSIKQLRRSRTDKMITGVCGGVASYFGVDASIVRIALVVGTFFSAGTGILLYAAAAILVPEEGTDS